MEQIFRLVSDTATSFPPGLRRTGYPVSVDIIFSDTYLDTSVANRPLIPAQSVKFTVIAKTDSGDQKLKI